MYKPKQKISPTIVVRKLHHVYDKVGEGSGGILEKVGGEVKKESVGGERKNHASPNTRIQVEEGEGIQELLRTAGILQDEIKPTKKT